MQSSVILVCLSPACFYSAPWRNTASLYLIITSSYPVCESQSILWKTANGFWALEDKVGQTAITEVNDLPKNTNERLYRVCWCVFQVCKALGFSSLRISEMSEDRWSGLEATGVPLGTRVLWQQEDLLSPCSGCFYCSLAARDIEAAFTWSASKRPTRR